MNRRDFLKNTSAAIAFAALPEALTADDRSPRFMKNPEFRAEMAQQNFLATPQALMTDNDWEDFEPSHYYGNGLHLFAQPSPAMESKMLETLWRDLCKIVPPPYRDRIYVHGMKTDYHRGFQLAWKYEPEYA